MRVNGERSTVNDRRIIDAMSLAPDESPRASRPLLHVVRDLARRLRPEEGLLVIGFVASACLTVYANVDLYQRGIRSRAIQGGLLRLAIVVLLAAALPLLERALRRGRGRPALLETAVFLRTMLPFLMCIAVYTNLHDTVRYVNGHDVHQQIAAVEEWIFGGQPVLWAEAYITPWRTDFFNFFYANFYLVAPSVVLVLWFSGRRDQARATLLGVILCFYTGYVLYVLLPAAPPRLVLRLARPVHDLASGRADHALPGGADRDDAEPRSARRVPQPARRRELSQPVLRLEILPLVPSDPAAVRGGPARGDRVSAPPLGRRSAGRRGARAVGAVDHATVRALLVEARSSGGGR